MIIIKYDKIKRDIIKYILKISHNELFVYYIGV